MFKDKDVCYINSRNLSKYFKINMNTGKIVWTFGKDGDFTMLSDHQDPWIEFAHAPEITFSGESISEILFYDNGSEKRGFSRVIKYRIDEKNMTAEIIYEFDGSGINKNWFTPFWGDVESQENGNIFITAGNFELTEESRLFEVTSDGQMVWELLLVQNGETMTSLYNSWKFKPNLKKR